LKAFGQNRWKKQSYFVGRNFGTVEIDWSRRTLQANVHDLSRAGDVVLSTGPISLVQQNRQENNETQLDQEDSSSAFIVAPTMDGHLRIPLAALVFLSILLATISWLIHRRRQRPTVSQWKKSA